MVHQTSPWELALQRTKQEFRNHQLRVSLSHPQNHTNNLSPPTPNRIRTECQLKNHTHINGNEKSFNSWLESVTVTKVVEPQRERESFQQQQQQHHSCVPSYEWLQRVGQAQQVQDATPSTSKSTANIRDVSCGPGKSPEAGRQDVIARSLALQTEIQNQQKYPLSAPPHTRTLSTSSGPSLSSSFASTASTKIATPVFDIDCPETLSDEKFVLPNQPTGISTRRREQKWFPTTPPVELGIARNQEYECVNIPPPPPPPEFIPSAILLGGHRPTSPTMLCKAYSVGLTPNPNYKGELTNFNLRNALCLPHENCSLRIHNIPPHASHSEIFSTITHGKVFSYNHTPAFPPQFSHAAVDLSFLTREAAQSFYNASKSPGLYILGQRILVLWNRIRVMPAEGRYSRMSRVVRIKGPASDFSAKTLEEFFRGKFEFVLISCKEWIQGDGMRIVEMGFASIRSQSESAVKSFNILVEGNRLGVGWRIWYAPDPCCRPDGWDNFRLSTR